MSTRPPFWVINLDAATARREFVAAAFDEIGAPFEIIEAVDGSHLSDDDRARYSRRRALYHVGRGLTVGEVGVALSHLRAYQRMLDEDIEQVVIFEDDARPSR